MTAHNPPTRAVKFIKKGDSAGGGDRKEFLKECRILFFLIRRAKKDRESSHLFVIPHCPQGLGRPRAEVGSQIHNGCLPRRWRTQLPEPTLAAFWDLELDPGIQPRDMDTVTSVLTAKPKAFPQNFNFA